MKFTLSWLYDHLQTEACLNSIVDTLNKIGLEVEEVVDLSTHFIGFEVVEIIETRPHPNADKLKICTIRTMTQTQTLICGAANARKGIKSILAHEGTRIPSNGMIIEKAKIRGIESHGMLCSAQELGISDDNKGIIELPEGNIGQSVVKALNLDDPVIKIAVTPNRPDCLGVRGIARDLSATGLGYLKDKIINLPPSSFALPFNISIETKICPVFSGRMIRNIKNMTSPNWLSRRLTAIGLRPLNALVDITNYIAYDQGRPLHVYDADKITGTIIARHGHAGESFTALNDKDYTVRQEDCVIADETSVLGLAGILGGRHSGTTLETKNIFIESAWFEPIPIAQTGRHHNIESDARYRFERGVDPQSVNDGLDLATQMMLEICGGDISSLTTIGKIPDHQKHIDFNPKIVEKMTGLNITEEKITHILTHLGFQIAHNNLPQFTVTSPSWRPDIEGTADLVEEIIRIYGLDNIPSIPLQRSQAVTQPALLTPHQHHIITSRRILASRGLTEMITWSFISEKQAAYFEGNESLKLTNPISVEMSHMRPHLLPGLLMSTKRNIDRHINDISLFEIGNVFHGYQPNEQSMMIVALRHGHRNLRHWRDTSENVDIFDMKLDAETTLQTLGITIEKLNIHRHVPDWYHPERSGILCYHSRTPLAVFGELHPLTTQLFGLEESVMAMEIYIENIPLSKTKKNTTKPPLVISNLQTVHRDFAFEVTEDIEANLVIKTIRNIDKERIIEVRLFDVFSGGQIADGMKSLAVDVTFQPVEKTFTETELDIFSAKIIDYVEKKTGGKLRIQK